ncbi:MAG: lysophospholipid acyltransferase family protein [Candidatus Latescibacteria bacterium]|nr:lysophospholipid acyltransferase family protein [Candidatus Latescibacterota bacterium]
MTDLGYTLSSLLARRLPIRVTDGIAHALADLYALSHPGRRRAVGRNLAWIWSQSGRAGPSPGARETYRVFARSVRDFLAQGPGRPGAVPRLSERARAALAEARGDGRGTLLVSAHFGPWERALQWLAAELGGVDALAAPHRFAAVERFFVARRAAGGVRTLCSTRPAMTAIQRLKSGGWLAALADRPFRSTSRNHVVADGIVSVDPAPLLLARRAGALVLPGLSCLSADGGLEIEFDRPFTMGARDGIPMTEGVGRIQRFFDRHVRAHPTQWFEWRLRRSPGSAGS